MLYVLINRTRNGLSPADLDAVADLTAKFYQHLPPNLRFVGDYNALDWSRNFAILEVDSLVTITRAMAPFQPYVDIEIIPVQPTAYFALLQKKTAA